MEEKIIRKAIRESVKKVLEEKKKGLLLEMPYPRSTYKSKVDSELPQIFINWCLVRYRTITNTEPYKKHWKGKTRGHMFNAARYTLKGNDSIETRRKVFNELLNENDYSQPQTMNLVICNKFIEEQIDIETDEYEQVIIDCINSIQKIFELILKRNIQEITSYIETI